MQSKANIYFLVWGMTIIAKPKVYDRSLFSCDTHPTTIFTRCVILRWLKVRRLIMSLCHVSSVKNTHIISSGDSPRYLYVRLNMQCWLQSLEVSVGRFKSTSCNGDSKIFRRGHGVGVVRTKCNSRLIRPFGHRLHTGQPSPLPSCVGSGVAHYGKGRRHGARHFVRHGSAQVVKVFGRSDLYSSFLSPDSSPRGLQNLRVNLDLIRNSVLRFGIIWLRAGASWSQKSSQRRFEWKNDRRRTSVSRQHPPPPLNAYVTRKHPVTSGAYENTRNSQSIYEPITAHLRFSRPLVLAPNWSIKFVCSEP